MNVNNVTTTLDFVFSSDLLNFQCLKFKCSWILGLIHFIVTKDTYHTKEQNDYSIYQFNNSQTIKALNDPKRVRCPIFYTWHISLFTKRMNYGGKSGSRGGRISRSFSFLTILFINRAK